MTAELTALALAGLLAAGQLGLASGAATQQTGLAWNISPRDTPHEIVGRAARLGRAFDNMLTALILFGVAVMVVTLGAATSGFTAASAWIFLVARLLYVPAYAFGWAPWRSAFWLTGFLATVAMILAALIGGAA